MLIRSTRHACFVILRNGLTLELFHAAGFTDARAAVDGDERLKPRPLATAPTSQGVWMFREEVLLEVTVGLA